MGNINVEKQSFIEFNNIVITVCRFLVMISQTKKRNYLIENWFDIVAQTIGIRFIRNGVVTCSVTLLFERFSLYSILYSIVTGVLQTTMINGNQQKYFLEEIGELLLLASFKVKHFSKSSDLPFNKHVDSNPKK
jgi:hypothetical protein